MKICRETKKVRNQKIVSCILVVCLFDVSFAALGGRLVFGDNEAGELGAGFVSNSPNYLLQPTTYEYLKNSHGVTGIRSVSNGVNTGAIITSDNEILVYGNCSRSSSCGTITVDQVNPVALPWTNPPTTEVWKQVSCGDAYCLLLSESGNVYAWGQGGNFRTGLSTTANTPNPTLISSGWIVDDSIIVFIDTYDDHSLAVSDQGSVYSWGRGDNRELGHASTASELVPRRIATFINLGIKVKYVSAGSAHSVAVDEDGNAWSWGAGDDRRLCHGDGNNKSTPTRIEYFVDNSISILRSDTSHAANFFLDTQGTLWSCGRRDNQATGNVVPGVNTDPPQPVTDLPTNVVAVSATQDGAIALTADNRLWGWGRGAQGENGGRSTANLDTANEIPTTTFDFEDAIDPRLFWQSSGRRYHTIFYSFCTNDCNGHGICTGLDICVCDSEWVGNACETPVDNDVTSTDGSADTGGLLGLLPEGVNPILAIAVLGGIPLFCLISGLVLARTYGNSGNAGVAKKDEEAATIDLRRGDPYAGGGYGEKKSSRSGSTSASSNSTDDTRLLEDKSFVTGRTAATAAEYQSGRTGIAGRSSAPTSDAISVLAPDYGHDPDGMSSFPESEGKRSRGRSRSTQNGSSKRKGSKGRRRPTQERR